MSITTLNDVLIAIAVTIGISVALSLAMVAAGAFYRPDKARAAQGIPAQHPTQTDDARELVLR